MERKIYNMLGFAQRAGKLASGEKACEANLKNGKAKILILALDATDGTKKNFLNMCRNNNVSYQIFGTKSQLGLAIGKSHRSTIVILDKDFAASLSGLFRG